MEVKPRCSQTQLTALVADAEILSVVPEKELAGPLPRLGCKLPL